MADTPITTDARPDRSEAFVAKRMDILRRVALAFAEDGYHQTSVNSLAARLGVSKPVLYYYAKNKDDLLYQCCLVAREELDEAIRLTDKVHLSGMGKVRRFFTTYAEIMCGDFGRCYVLVDPQNLEPSLCRKEIEGRRGLETSVRKMICEGQEDGSVRKCDPALAARAMFGAFNGMPRWFDAGGELKAGDVAEAYIDLFVTGMARG